MIRLVKFILFAVRHGQDFEKLNYRKSETSLKCTNRRMSGMENIGSNPLGLPAVVVVTDVQLLVTMMYMHQSFAVEDVGSFTRENTAMKTGRILTTRSAAQTSNTTIGPCRVIQDEIGHTRKKRRGGKQKGCSSAQHLHSVSHSQIL